MQLRRSHPHFRFVNSDCTCALKLSISVLSKDGPNGNGLQLKRAVSRGFGIISKPKNVFGLTDLKPLIIPSRNIGH